MFRKTKLDYDFSVFLNADYESHSGSCIKHQVYEQKDIHDRFGNFPNTYCLENTTIHQLWWDKEQVNYDELGKQLRMEVISVSTIRQDPGHCIPIHRDEFYQIKMKYPDRKETKVRANIFLEDWKMGHFLQHGSTVETYWSAGEGCMWDREVEHLSANAGLEPKYTLQISGFLKE